MIWELWIVNIKINAWSHGKGPWRFNWSDSVVIIAQSGYRDQAIGILNIQYKSFNYKFKNHSEKDFCISSYSFRVALRGGL